MISSLGNAAAFLPLAALALSCSGSFSGPEPAPQVVNPAAWSASDLTIAYIGHASVLIDFGGVWILTDPTLYDRIGPSLGPVTIGPKRVSALALDRERIPKLDAILITHAHMDSLDRPSLAPLADTPLLITPERTRDLVDDLGYARVVELGWGQHETAGEVSIEAVEVRHWGRRWPWGGWRGYAGYLIRRGDLSLLFASDTAYSPQLAAFARARGVQVLMLGIGAYDPWIWNHETPEQAWQTFAESGASYLIPVHWDTFRLGKEPLGEAMRRLLAAAGPDASRVVIHEIGGTWRVPLR